MKTPVDHLSKWVLCLCAAFFLVWGFLWVGCLPYYVDASLYGYPDRALSLESFRRGLIPLWNPFIACGTPHLANWTSTCFYPLFWVFNFTGLQNYFMWMALAHLGIAFLGFRLWLQSQGAGPLLSALGALSFVGSAHLVCCATNICFVTTAAWIPWVFWAAHQASRSSTFHRWSLVGCFLAMECLGGYPYFLFYTVFFLLLWFEIKTPSPKPRLYLWGTLLITAGLTSAQWLPFLDFLKISWHEPWDIFPYFNKPIEYLALLKPDALGTLGSKEYLGNFPNGNFNLYFGLIPLLALIAGLFWKASGRFWTLAALLWLLWGAGRHFPLLRIFPSEWLEFSAPSKSAGVFVFCAATAAILTLQSLTSKFKEWKFLGLATAVVSLLWMIDLFRISFLFWHPMPNLYQDHSLMESSLTAVKLAGQERILSVQAAGETSFEGEGSMGKAFDSRFRLILPNSNEVWGLRSADKYLYLQVDGTQNLTRYMDNGFPYRGDLLDIAGVRLFLTPLPLPVKKYNPIGRQEKTLLVLNSEASPDLRFAPGQIEVANRPSLLNRLAFPQSGWRKTVYLEKSGDGSRVGLTSAKRDLSPSSVKQTQRRAGAAFYLSDSRNQGWVVFNETFAPGWRAWVDGKPEPILRAYGLFMTVPVGGGKHQVSFRYEPTSFRLGLFLSLLSLAGILLGWSWSRNFQKSLRKPA